MPTKKSLEEIKNNSEDLSLKESCLFCEPWLFRQERQILLKSDNFYLFAGLGAIVEGYIIIAPYKCNEHNLQLRSFADSTNKLIDELVFLRHLISEFYRDSYGYGHSGMHFEHGRTGVCMSELLHTRHCYHAHLCCYPVNYSIWQDIKSLRVETLCDIYELPVRAGSWSYLFIENFKSEDSEAENDYWDTHISFLKSETDIPPQYLRRLLAKRVGDEHLWDWAAFPQWNLVNKLIDDFKTWITLKEKYSIRSDNDTFRISTNCNK